jgi:hypothetical protein
MFTDCFGVPIPLVYSILYKANRQLFDCIVCIVVVIRSDYYYYY